MLEREVAVGERLGLDALRGVDEQHHPLAGGEAPRDLVAEVDVARGVDQVEDVVAPVHPHVLGLDRDAALALDVHRVEVLGPHVAWVDRPGQLEDAIRQRRLAVVDVADDREVANELGGDHAVHRAISAAPCRPPRVWLVLWPAPEAIRLWSVRVEGRMANIKSQIKRNRQNERRRVKNKAVRSELKTRTKNALIAAETGAEDTAERLREAVKRIDKAAAKGVIHANQASRRKSRLARRIAALTSEDAEES